MNFIAINVANAAWSLPKTNKGPSSHGQRTKPKQHKFEELTVERFNPDGNPWGGACKPLQIPGRLWEAFGRGLQAIANDLGGHGNLLEGLASYRKALEGPGSPWGALQAIAKPWKALGASWEGTLQAIAKHLGGHGNLFGGPCKPPQGIGRPWEPLGVPCKPLQDLGRPWGLLECLASHWKVLEGVGATWRALQAIS